MSADGDYDPRAIPESCLVILDQDMGADLQRWERAGCCVIALPGGFLLSCSCVAVVCCLTPATGEGGVVHRHRATDGVSV